MKIIIIETIEMVKDAKRNLGDACNQKYNKVLKMLRMHKYFNHFYSTYFIQNDGNDSNDYDEVQKLGNASFLSLKAIRAKQPLLQINS